ncbi:MAG: LysR family transcriptional regulator [Burkholderiaceae bacterium]|nr:LysR family transcriptional regulator [Burkholderiaceae bacterium]
MLTTRQIEVLHALLSTGSATSAGHVLGISQPAVSNALQQVERRLGYRLFERSGTRLLPTAEALSLWPEIEPLAERLLRIRELASNLRAGGGETLQVAALPSVAQAILPLAIAQLPARGRGRIAIQALNSRQIATELLLRGIDIAFDYGGPLHPGIQRESIVTADWVCAAPLGSLARSATVTPSLLARQRTVSVANTDPIRERLAAVGYVDDGASDLSVRSFPVALRFVELGQGLAILDPFTAASADPQRVSLHRLDPPPVLTLYRVSPAARPAPAQAASLFEAMRSQASELIARTFAAI